MSLKRFFLICLVVLLLLSPVHARDYSLKGAAADVTVRSDGVVHVSESITYSFDGTYREVFRRVYPPPGGSIENIEIGCRPEPCQGRVDTVSGGYELVGVLPQPTPSEITFTVSYDYYRGLKVYDDVSELHYKLWGDDWEKPLDRLTAAVHLPPMAAGKTRYWFHPSAYIQAQAIEGSTITTEAGTIPSNSWYEVRAVFPRLENPDSSKVRVINGAGLPEIERIEDAYAAKQGRAKNIYLVVWFLAAVIVAVPFYIYHRYGREPEINYHALYEREPPSKSKPAAVNAIMRGSIGKPDLNAFFATIMDLVHRGFISLKDVKTEKRYLGLFSRTEDDIIIEIKDKGTEGLLDFELDALNFLLQNSEDGRISWLKLKEELGKDSTFYDFIVRWGDLVERHIKVEKLFDSTGNYLLMGFGAVVLFLSIAGTVAIANYYPLKQFPGITRAVAPGLLIFAVGLGSLFIAIVNEKGAGRFTPEGRLYYERWRRFRDYLTDFSALKEHPPESVRLWDQYMVYAVALGVAEKVIENMSRIVPGEEIRSSGFYAIQNQPAFFTGLRSAYNASNPASSAGGGGVGGIGGGFGGGGGGAR
ncbi:MAG: DUF2207 domain-containing protein [Methanobacteriota archaeon]|nr:MAG: DUF2207 domain-containing protein [Euryarchaeota archaeon]